MVNPYPKIVLATIFIGVLLRFLGLFGDLWLDEIWSLNFAADSRSLFELISIPHDNNHPMNSVWLYICGPNAPFWLYRSFSFVCSLVTLALVIRWSRFLLLGSRTLLVIFTSLSYLLILYGSEARGYGPLLMFAVLTLGLECQYFENPQTRRGIGFFLASIAGLFSHLVFIHLIFVLALTRFFWCVSRKKIKLYLIVYLPTLGVIGAYLAIVVSGITFGGGPIHSLWDTFFSSFSVGAGGEIIRAGEGKRAVVFAALGLIVYCLSCVEAVRLWQRSKMLSGILLGFLVFVPAVFLWWLAPSFAQPRYLLFSILASNVAMISLCTRLWQRDVVGKFIAAIFVGIFTAGNLKNAIELAYEGRGQYSKALTTIKEQSNGWPTTIATAQDFRVRTVLDFYAQRNGYEPPEIVNTDAATPWKIIDRSGEEQVSVLNCLAQGEFPSASLSGTTWQLYWCPSS